MAGFRPFVIALIGIIAFSFFLISFITQFVVITNPSSDLLQSKYKLNQSYNSLNNSMKDLSGAVDSMVSGVNDENFKPSPTDYIFLIALGFFYIPFSLLKFGLSGISSIIYVLTSSMAYTFGSAGLLGISLISSVLIITFILLLLKQLRGGESER